MQCNSPPIRRIDIEEFPLVEIEGPWNAVCQVGHSTMKLGFGLKWGMFIRDSDERMQCLQEAVCMARSVGALRMVGFANEGYGSQAYETSLLGGSFATVVQELQSSARMIEATIANGVPVKVLSDRLGAVAAILEGGFLIVTLQAGR